MSDSGPNLLLASVVRQRAKREKLWMRGEALWLLLSLASSWAYGSNGLFGMAAQAVCGAALASYGLFSSHKALTRFARTEREAMCSSRATCGVDGPA
jgi:hypothetical protein